MDNGSSGLPVVNAAAYRFASLDGLGDLRARLIASCRQLALRGTILLSPEGINLFVSGEGGAVEALLAQLRNVAGLEGLAARMSRSARQPFHRMLVKIKREIIAFGVAGIEPARRTSKRILPGELRRWLDEGRSFTLLDTRNDYEIRLGSFRGARAAGVEHFRDFPAAVARLPEALKQQPVVTFCTGGIRCEKAAPYLESAGFGDVYQLDGGILRYFEECGGAHFDGECFVFDQRVGVDARLQETSTAQCFVCLAPLTAVEQADPRHVPGQSCPHCHRPTDSTQRAQLAKRNQQLAALLRPLPGSLPADNLRPLSVPLVLDGATLHEAFTRCVRSVPPEHWNDECARGNLLDGQRNPVPLDRRVRAGERYLHRIPLEIEPAVSAAVTLLYEDEALLVLDKPAPLPMHPGGRFRRNTLQFMLETLYRPQKPRPAHRLDANTTGVVIAGRTRQFAARLQAQFAAGQVLKRYLVRVDGHPAADFFECDAPLTPEAGAGGLRRVDARTGVPALTQFRVVERSADGSSLLEARPVTGRTNQIRLHCAHLGIAIRGDAAFGQPGARGRAHTHGIDDPPLCLHAWEIRFRHPVGGAQLAFSAPAPDWAGDRSGTLAC